jgi:hypothetical protein
MPCPASRQRIARPLGLTATMIQRLSARSLNHGMARPGLSRPHRTLPGAALPSSWLTPVAFQALATRWAFLRTPWAEVTHWSRVWTEPPGRSILQSILSVPCPTIYKASRAPHRPGVPQVGEYGVYESINRWLKSKTAPHGHLSPYQRWLAPQTPSCKACRARAQPSVPRSDGPTAPSSPRWENCGTARRGRSCPRRIPVRSMSSTACLARLLRRASPLEPMARVVAPRRPWLKCGTAFRGPLNPSVFPLEQPRLS